MHQNVNCGRGGAGGGSAHRIVHKLTKTITFEVDVIQKLHIGKLSNLAHIILTYGCLYQYHLISATWATTNKTILFYPGYVNMQKI